MSFHLFLVIYDFFCHLYEFVFCNALDLQELTPAILNDMIKRVYVHAPQMIDGKRTQEIDICYDLVGILPKALFQRNEETA